VGHAELKLWQTTKPTLARKTARVSPPEAEPRFGRLSNQEFSKEVERRYGYSPGVS
jgi:hypothetical protein